MTKYVKAILSAIIAVVGGLITGYAGDNELSAVEILTAVNLGLVSLVGVFMVPNKTDTQSVLTEPEVTALVNTAITNHPLMEQLDAYLKAQGVVSHS